MIFSMVFLTIICQTAYSHKDESLKSLLLNGNYQTVIDTLEGKFEREKLLSFSEFNILGTAYFHFMNFQKAIPNLYEASKLEPGNIQNLIMLGNCYSYAGNGIQAQLTYENVLNLDPLNKTAMISLAKVLMDLEEFNKASGAYHKLISADSTNAYFFSQLGLCELKQGEKDLAKINFEISLRLNETNSKTTLWLAKLYYNDKEYDKASILLKNGLSQNSKNKALNRMLADVFYKQDQFNQAILKYLSAITLGDTTADTFQKLGLSYYYLSFTNSYIITETRKLKLEEGIAALNKAIQKDENDPISSLYLGLCYKELEYHETAIIYFNETLNKIFPEYLEIVYSNLGSCYDETGEYAASIKTYKEALTYNPGKSILHFYLANIYDRYYEDKSVAVLYYHKFLNENKDADEKLIEFSQGRIDNLYKEASFWKK